MVTILNDSDECFEQAVLDLEKLSAKAIVLAEFHSLSSGASIVAKARKAAIYILDYYREVPLLTCFFVKFLLKNPPIKRYLENFSARPVDTISKLVDSQGGLTKATTNLRNYLRSFGQTSGRLENAELIYGSEVLGVLVDIKSATTRRYVRRYHLPLPYCALCWRRVEDSKYYCQLHHPKQSSNRYYSARTALFNAVKITKPQFRVELKKTTEGRSSIQLALQMNKWTASFAPPVAGIKALFPSVDDPKNSWQEVASMIVVYCKESYPLTYKKLGDLSSTSFESWRNFSLAVIAVLDPIESAFWEADELNDWLQLKQPFPAWITLLAMLGRHEAYEYICCIPNRPGPNKGDVSVNELLRHNIRAEVEKIEAKGGKVVQAQIARKLGVSRNVINRHMRKLDLR